MVRSRVSTTLTVVGIVAVLACVFGETPPANPEVDVKKSHEGLSTASDTLKKESEAITIDGFSADEFAALRKQAVHREFKAEVNRMMTLIINSLYQNKEIFLRELISNASDALDKIRVLSLTDRDALSATEEMAVRIKVNKEARTLHITDTGIGMDMDDLSVNLGTIAKSGTSDFISNMTNAQTAAENADLIGKFGVGFYSSFLVSKKVMVISKKNDHPQYVWESDSHSFSVTEDPRGNTLKRGTEIIIFLTDEAEDYLQTETLKKLIKKFSQFIRFPIYLWSSRVETVKVEPEPTDDTSADSDSSVEEEKKPEEKTTERTVTDWVLINDQKPIWIRRPNEVTEGEHKEFYKALSNDQDDPLAKTHFKAEGDVTFNSVLYIPKRSPNDLFNVNYKYKDRIKLYVNRVFISDAAEEFLPKYLGFVIGIVDSDDLPLNVSREMLQQHQLIKVIRKKLIRKAIEMMNNLSKEDFEKLWKEFSSHLKLGVMEDHSNRSRLAKLLRFRTTKSGEEFVSLSDYVSRMKDGQDHIFYLTGSSMEEVKTSPFLERVIKKGYEVIYMIDPLDEFMMQSLTEFEKKSFHNVAKEGMQLKESEETKARKEAEQKEYDNLLKWLKEDALKDKIEKAELSSRLSDSPCALVASTYGWSGNMERIMRAQAHQKGDDSSAQFYSNMKKILELNPRHPLVKELNKRVKLDSSDVDAKQTAELLLHVATLRSGYTIRDSVQFARQIESVMRKNLDVPEYEEAEQEVFDDATEESDSPKDEDQDEVKATGDTPEPVQQAENDKENIPAKEEL